MLVTLVIGEEGDRESGDEPDEDDGVMQSKVDFMSTWGFYKLKDYYSILCFGFVLLVQKFMGFLKIFSKTKKIGFIHGFSIFMQFYYGCLIFHSRQQAAMNSLL